MCVRRLLESYCPLIWVRRISSIGYPLRLVLLFLPMGSGMKAIIKLEENIMVLTIMYDCITDSMCFGLGFCLFL